MSGRSQSAKTKTPPGGLKYKISEKDVTTTVFFKDSVSDDEDLEAVKLILESDEDSYVVYPNESMPKNAYTPLDI